MNNGIDEKTVAEFLDYYQETVMPNPDHYPRRFEFMIKMFLHNRKRKADDGCHNTKSR
jgi:hypothetical protein